jgi:hypothetical protein
MTRISAAAGVGLDSAASTHFLAEAGLDYLPRMMLNAASAANAAGQGDLDAARAAMLAAARYEMAQANDDVGTSVATAVAATGAEELIGQLDALQSAVGAIGSVTVERPGSFVASMPPGAIDRLLTAALALDQAILSRVDDLLVDQQARTDTLRRLTFSEAVGVVVGAIALVLLLGPRRRVGLIETRGEKATEKVEEPRLAVVGARDLLGLGELANVGRAVQSRRANDDAE